MAATSEITENSNVENSEVSKVEVGKTANKFRLSDLKVTDLKTELEKRDLDKTGVKSVLFERLKNALLEEGEDPEEFAFEAASDCGNCKSPLKKKKALSPGTNGEVDIKEEKKDIEDDVKVDAADVNKFDNKALENTEETTDINNDIDDKCSSSDVTLQLSIDEEDAQLNEDENILEVSKPNNDETEEPKSDAKIEENAVQMLEVIQPSEVPSIPSTPVKQPKSSNEEGKERKKTPLPSKNVETSNALSPKVLKVLGKNDKIKNANALAISLWITGLPNTTRAADLKALFSKQGRVLSVKIVKSTKQTPGKCYGFVTMASCKDASKAIQNLHRTELNGRTISVERTQNEPGVLLKKSESKLINQSAKKQMVKKETSTKPVESSKISASSKTSERKISKQDPKPTESKAVEASEKQKEKSSTAEKLKVKERERRSREHRERDSRRPAFRRPPPIRPRPFIFNERPRFGVSRRPFIPVPRPYNGRSNISSPNIRPSRIGDASFSFQKIREERLKLREEREAERRRLLEITRHRYIERKQREEAYRLEREKEKLRLEREMLERERVEILKLEREKQRLERERLEREREELRRQSELRRGMKRSIGRSDREHEEFWDSRKKPVPRYEARTSFPSESSTSSRYEIPIKERPVLPRHEFERRTERYSQPKPLESASRMGYEDRSRREVTIRSRDERQVYDRSIFRADRDGRPSFQDRERHSSSTTKREAPKVDWKHDRRVHERVISSTSSSVPRRMYY